MSDPESVDVITAEDEQTVIDNALDELGLTFDELTAQAKAGHFSSIAARLAWIAIGGLRRLGEVEE